jgi:dipeptidyl aminopeptidase/acylaminoacyl peptidase
MKIQTFLLHLVFLAAAFNSRAQVPDNLVIEGVPAIPPELKQDVSRYLEFRSAAFNSWHPQRREMLITTRFADTPQLHVVKMPLGDRRQLTFLPEPVAGGSFRPLTGDFIVFAQDIGGGEFYQLYRYDLSDGRITLLTDGKSRNSVPRWSHHSSLFAYTSTRRTGKDTDIYLLDPAQTNLNRLLIEVSGGGWSVLDWSDDDSKLLLGEYISINESYLYVADAKTGEKQLITPRTVEKVAWGEARFAKDGKSIFVTTDKDSEFQGLCRLELGSGKLVPLTADIPWNVDTFDVSRDGKLIGFVTNEDGVSKLHVINSKTGRTVHSPKLPLGVIGGVEWHDNSRDLAFSMNSARSPTDAYSLDMKTGEVQRWTASETGGLNAETFVEPELVKLKGFDGLGISAFVYLPDPKRFPGPRPVLINIHGGPESQSRPVFQARNNFYLNELGIALVYPNVRGSDGYGKTFLTLDNSFKREDSVKDIGAVIDWIKRDARLDGRRIAVIGGSYGGYMVLASMIHFNDRLRCGVDVVGISNFLTFLKNTQDYRRDLRRAEYGDERDDTMRQHLEKISPTTNVRRITKPLFIVQGKNDPRVPVTESEQMVKALRDQGTQVWYLMAKDEGHGFGKKKNADFQFLSTILFLQQFLLN